MRQTHTSLTPCLFEGVFVCHCLISSISPVLCVHVCGGSSGGGGSVRNGGSPLMTPCSFCFGAGGMGMGSKRECNDMALGAD